MERASPAEAATNSILNLLLFIFAQRGVQTTGALRACCLNGLLGADYLMNSGHASSIFFFRNPKTIAHAPLMPGRFGDAVAAQFSESRSRIPRNPVRGADPRFDAGRLRVGLEGRASQGLARLLRQRSRRRFYPFLRRRQGGAY